MLVNIEIGRVSDSLLNRSGKKLPAVTAEIFIHGVILGLQTNQIIPTKVLRGQNRLALTLMGKVLMDCTTCPGMYGSGLIVFIFHTQETT